MTYREMKDRVSDITTSVGGSFALRFCKAVKKGIADIVSFIPICVCEHYVLHESVIDICKLKRQCFEVRAVKADDGTDIPFEVQTASQYIDVPLNVRSCTVCYRYIPHRMESYQDEPDIPKELHELLYLYVLAKEYCKDEDAQEAMMLYEKKRDEIIENLKDKFLVMKDE